MLLQKWYQSIYFKEYAIKKIFYDGLHWSTFCFEIGARLPQTTQSIDTCHTDNWRLQGSNPAHHKTWTYSDFLFCGPQPIGTFLLCVVSSFWPIKSKLRGISTICIRPDAYATNEPSTICLSIDWINAAANFSSKDVPSVDSKKEIATLSDAKKNEYLLRLINEENNLAIKLKNELSGTKVKKKENRKISISELLLQ